jgi:hypothetical protein
VLTTTQVQPLPTRFPLLTAPRSHVAWRMPVARGRRCRTSPPHRSEQAHEDNTLASCPLRVYLMRSWHCHCSPRYSLAFLPCSARVHDTTLLCQALATATPTSSRPIHGTTSVDIKGLPLPLACTAPASHLPSVRATSSPVFLPFRIIAINSSLQPPPCLVCRPQRSSP